MQIIKTLDETYVESAPHPRRRIIILSRDDGHFTSTEQYYYCSEYEGEIVAEGWATLHVTTGIYATAAIAEAEALAAMSRWNKQAD